MFLGAIMGGLWPVRNTDTPASTVPVLRPDAVRSDRLRRAGVSALRSRTFEVQEKSSQGLQSQGCARRGARSTKEGCALLVTANDRILVTFQTVVRER